MSLLPSQHGVKCAWNGVLVAPCAASAWLNEVTFGMTSCLCSGPFQVYISNQQLHCAFTRQRLQVFQAFANQLAAFYAPAPSPVHGSLSQGGIPCEPVVEASPWAGDDSCDADTAACTSDGPVHVMEGVVPDAFTG